MTRKVKALRALALLTAMSGASVLALSAGSTSAKASEERLHNEQFSTYGLLPPGSVRASSNEGGDSVTSASVATVEFKAPARKANDEPQIEDPALPGYDGPGTSPASNHSIAK